MEGVCSVVGGRLPTPQSIEEVKEMLEEMGDVFDVTQVSPYQCGDEKYPFHFVAGQVGDDSDELTTYYSS